MNIGEHKQVRKAVEKQVTADELKVMRESVRKIIVDGGSLTVFKVAVSKAIRMQASKTDSNAMIEARIKTANTFVDDLAAEINAVMKSSKKPTALVRK